MSQSILLVEDNPADVRLIQEAFRTCEIPHRLTTASDGEQAIDTIFSCGNEPSCPDLVLLDLNLPRCSGHDVLRAIKGHPKTRAVPVIIMSSSDALSDVVRAYDSHANCYITKPKNLEDLFCVVRAINAFWFQLAVLPGARMGLM